MKIRRILADDRLRHVALYLLFGVLATVVNIVTYVVCVRFMPNVPATCLAWGTSVLFAFFTNQRYVFSAHGDVTKKKLFFQLVSFIGFRLMSGVMDVGIMWLSVDVMALPDIAMKIVANIIVVIVNYLISKCWVFKG